MDFEQLNNTIKNYLDNDKTNSAIMLYWRMGFWQKLLYKECVVAIY